MSSFGALATEDSELKFLPIFTVGNPEAEFVIDLTWSVNCPESREVIEAYYMDIIDYALENDDLLLYFHTNPVTQSDVDATLEFLSVGMENYGMFSIAALKWSVQEQKSLSSRRIKKLKKKLGLQDDPGFDRDEALHDVLAYKMYLQEEFEITRTTNMYINWEAVELPETFDEMIETMQAHGVV